mmetsp:Transcript_13439/g.48896  ORF Transcript_13439/g.48896 Transcript_13439/m.48896 type:complete len:237 (+) Transcript_13439:1621-2331(+)
MTACILYCVTSFFTKDPSPIIVALSIKDTARPCATASAEIMVGGSCCTSPASTARLPRSSGIQEDGSVAWPLSSIMTRSKGGNSRNSGSPLETFVPQTTSASLKTSTFKCISRRRSSLPILLICRRILTFSSFFLVLLIASCRIFLAALPSLPKASILSATRASRLTFCASLAIRSVTPTRTTFSSSSLGDLLLSFSTILSIAALDGAVTSTFSPLWHAHRTIRSNTDVLPVPGGP